MGGPVGDAGRGGAGRRHGGETGDLVDVGGAADVRTVGAWAAASRRVDDKLHLAVGDEVGGGGAGAVTLADLGHHHLDGNAVVLEELARAFGGADREAQLDEAHGGSETFLLVAI